MGQVCHRSQITVFFVKVRLAAYSLALRNSVGVMLKRSRKRSLKYVPYPVYRHYQYSP